ncbi:MAG: hypothetical protein KKA64_03905 [Nanoarchaeota archaeon]|nr:hypothetical protein [Nanoarchaeota archaeon]
MALVLIAIFSLGGFNQSATGQIIGTTEGASYGRISNEFNKYRQCNPVLNDDQWGVMEKTKIGYYTPQGKGPFYIEDVCFEKDRVREYYCDTNGYILSSIVICPDHMTCKDGACV